MEESFEYRITIMGRPPSKSNSYGTRVVYKNGKAMGVIYTTKELKAYQAKGAKEIDKVISETLECPLIMEIDFYQHGRTLDIDNIIKAIFDAGDVGKGYAKHGWKDDKLFYMVLVERKKADSKENERVELIIKPYLGEF